MKEKMVASLPDARGGEEEEAASEVPALLPLLPPAAVGRSRGRGCFNLLRYRDRKSS